MAAANGAKPKMGFGTHDSRPLLAGSLHQAANNSKGFQLFQKNHSKPHLPGTTPLIGGNSTMGTNSKQAVQPAFYQTQQPLSHLHVS
jgi:hypothetical protein